MENKKQKSRYKSNPEEIIIESTKNIISLHTNFEKQIHILTQLNGVGVPVASAILTVIFPKHYCVLDYRAFRALLWITSKSFRFVNYIELWNILENFRNYATLESYTNYLEKIKNLATKHRISPRKIEMALWMYDKRKGIL